MMMLSTDGVLVPFFMVYKHKAAANMTTPSEALNPSGLRPQIRKKLLISFATPSFRKN